TLGGSGRMAHGRHCQTPAELESSVPRRNRRVEMTLRTAGLAAVAMTAFAANSLLCRAALGAHAVDALTFTTVRLVSGALVLALLARGRAKGQGGVTAWRLGAALFFYAVGFSLAYTRITAAVGALLLFGAVQVTMIGAGLVAGERPLVREWLGLALA